MNDSRRVSKVAHLIRGELTRTLIEEVSDPALTNLTVMDVELSADLREAKVYFEGSSHTDKEIENGFRRASPFFRKRLGENLNLRYVPNLTFVRDKHNQQVSRVMSLLDEVKHS